MRSAVLAFLAANAAAASGASLPKRMSGFYCLVADDTVANYTSTAVWQPSFYDYQVKGANTFFLTFVNPELMPKVPPAMAALGKCKGEAGCSPKGVPLIFSVGGEAYSNKPWSWLQSQSAAEAMAAEVAKWGDEYGADGIDLDIEGSAGSAAAAPNLAAFARKLRSLKPDFIITQPVYGYPQVAAENYMVNHGWANSSGTWQSTGLIDTVGIMVYNGAQSLNYVKDYAHGTKQWQGFPIHVDVTTSAILAGIQGTPGDSTITDLAKSIVSQDLGGFMVWFASVYDKTRSVTALSYGGKPGQPGYGDASRVKSAAWAQAVQIMNN